MFSPAIVMLKLASIGALLTLSSFTGTVHVLPSALASPVDVSVAAPASGLAVAMEVEVDSRASAVGNIDQATYDNLVRYTKYSSAVYQWICPAPLGNKLVDKFDIAGTQGFVVRDDSRKEIIVAFRGTLEVADAFIDLQIIQIPLKSTGLTNVGDAYVHTGFLFAYNVVARTVLSIITAQNAAYPSHRIIVTGHSLGGAVASLAAVSIKSALPAAKLQLYTYGQPRTGNAAFATYVEGLIGVQNIFRAVHTYDGVPTILFKALGYRHFANEYWNFADSSGPAYTKKCNGGDDPSCSDSIPSTFINPAHLSYYGQSSDTKINTHPEFPRSVLKCTQSNVQAPALAQEVRA